MGARRIPSGTFPIFKFFVGSRANNILGSELTVRSASADRATTGRNNCYAAADTTMQIGIVADTHDDAAIVEAAVEQFESSGVDAVVHCGDFVAPFSAAPFDAAFDFFAVRGNNDGEWGLQPQIDDFGTYLGEMGELTFDGTEVAVYHGTSGAIVDALVECGNYDYVVHGHTHQQGHEEHEGTVRINPGGVPIDAAPERPTTAVIDTEADEVEFTEL